MRVSIGMWEEIYRFKLNEIVSHRSLVEMKRMNKYQVLGELVDKEFERISRPEEYTEEKIKK